MRRTAVIIGIVLGIGLVLIWSSGTIWDGAYNFSVSIRTIGPVPIQRVACRACSTEEQARQFLEYGFDPGDYRVMVANPFAGSPLTVMVPVSGHTQGIEGFLIHETRSQSRLLVIEVGFRDGTQLRKIVDIPDGQKTQSLVVTFP
jgi:hypothetical protein